MVTGRERGIVSAMTYEAKVLGVKRAMKISDVRKLSPDIVVLPSDYETYSIFSHRMYAIVRRYTPTVEEYSIDECFADLTGLRRSLRMPYVKIAEAIKSDLECELGMSFSMGVSCTKSLAKLGSKWKKPAGLTAIPLRDVADFLKATPIEKVWGIGSNTSAYLKKYRIDTAQDFVSAKEEWVRAHLSKPFVEIWQELRGEVVYEVSAEGRETYQSISKTKTFTPPSTDRAFVFAQLSKNVENACIKARRWELVTPVIFFFLKTQDFRYHGCEITLPFPTALPSDVLREVEKQFEKLWRSRTPYRATGITLTRLRADTHTQLDLFGHVADSRAVIEIFKSVDAMSARYGKHALFLGSSLTAMKFGNHFDKLGTGHLGETKRRRLPIPLLGEV